MQFRYQNIIWYVNVNIRFIRKIIRRLVGLVVRLRSHRFCRRRHHSLSSSFLSNFNSKIYVSYFSYHKPIVSVLQSTTVITDVPNNENNE